MILKTLSDDLFELNDIRRKLPNAVSELVGSHGVLVEHPAEGLFVEIDFFDVGAHRLSGIQLASKRCGGVLEILEKVGADREQVATGEFRDLTDVSEAGAHHLRLVAELFVVVVDFLDGLDTGILRTDVFFAGGGFVVIVNATNERRDEARVGLRAGDGLWEREEERQIAIDAFFLADRSGLGTFPCRGDLDEHTLTGRSLLLVETDEVASLFDGSFNIERKSGINFGGNSTGNDRENFASERNEKIVDDLAVKGSTRERAGAVIGHGLLEEGLVFRLLNSLVDQRGVRRRVLGCVGANAFEVSSIGDNGGELLELFERIRLAHNIMCKTACRLSARTQKCKRKCATPAMVD